MPKVIKNCSFCQNQFITYNEKQVCCSRKCSAHYFTGEKNPNYGKKWTDDKKSKQSEIIKSKVDSAYREKCSSGNKGKKFSQSRIDSMHAHRESSSYSRPHSESTKKLIGEKSKAKFSKEYKQKQRQAFIERGLWISDQNKSDYEIYRKHADWVKPMWFLAEKETLEQIGIFNSNTNRNGLVRDHKLSKVCGLKNGIFPEILRHPVNCQIITHSENSSKREKSSLTIEELFDLVESYDGEWEEHYLVLRLINEWRNGKRFSADEYRRKSDASSFSSL